MKALKILFIMMLYTSLTGCFRNFYQTNTTAKIDSVKMEQHIDEKKVFIIHTYGEIFELSKAKLGSGVISGEKTVLDSSYETYKSPASPKANAFKKKNAQFVFSQVHLYTMQKFPINGPVILSDSLIFRADAYGPDVEATKKSKTASIVGICAVPVAACFAILAISAVNDMEKIPFVILTHL
jgi:hypothetical protein